MKFGIGDRVRIDILDSDDRDHRFHGETGEVVEILRDDLGELFDDPRLNHLIKVEFGDDDLGTMIFRVHGLEAE